MEEWHALIDDTPICFDSQLKNPKKLHCGLFLWVEELSLTLYAPSQLLGPLARNTENLWSCEGGLSAPCKRKSMSTKDKAIPTGSLDLWQEPLARHVHTHAHDLWWPASSTCSHPESKHQVRPGPGPYNSEYPASSCHKKANPSGSWPLPPTAQTSGWQIIALMVLSGCLETWGSCSHVS